MEFTLNEGVSPRLGDPLDQHLLQVTCYGGLLALSLDNIIGEIIDNEKSGHTTTPERSSYYMTADHETFVFSRTTSTKSSFNFLN